jgi:O-antigen ligase
MVMGSIGIATNLKSDEYMELLALMCFLCAVASVLLYLAVPSMAYGGPDSTGDFRGIFSQKNILGEAMTIGALACLHGLRVNRRRRNRNLVFLGVVAVLAIMSGSATSSVTVVIFCLVHVAGEMIRKGGAARPLAIMVLVLAMPVILFAAAAPETLMELIGKDPTLTGRTEIWAYVIADIYRKPLLGWGYLGFWTFDNPAAVEISNALHWFAPQSHNGLLEILLYVGFIGAAYFIFLWARLVWLAVRCLPTPDYAAGMSCLLSCIGVLLVGISETVLVVPFEASTSVFFITGFLCERALRTARVRRRRPVRANAARAGRSVRAPAMQAATASARRAPRPGGVR